MTCRTVREHLLQGDSDFQDVQRHLTTCTGCAQLASVIRSTETAFVHHVEDFAMNTANLDAQWAHATRTVPPSATRRSWGLHGVLVAAAACAVAAVASWSSGGPPEPTPTQASTVPAAVATLEDLTEHFETIDTEAPPPEGIGRKEEDRWLQKTLSRKVAALLAAEEHAIGILEDPGTQPDARVAATVQLADLYGSMGHALAKFATPTYLSDDQRAVYEVQLAAKARAQWTKALETYDRAVQLATQHGLSPAMASAGAADLRSHMARFDASMAADPRLSEPYARDARMRLEKELDTVRDVQEACSAGDFESQWTLDEMVKTSEMLLAGPAKMGDGHLMNLARSGVESQRRLLETHCGSKP